MEPLPNIPPPVTFNSFKHHKQTICETIAANAGSEEFVGSLSETIGSNYVDIYTGTLSPVQISEEITGWLAANQLLVHSRFTAWISCPGNFRAIALSDASLWILREGDNAERYIHIHPAKTGAHTARYKATSLISAYTVRILSPEIDLPGLQTFNTARKQAGLSPVKSLQNNKGLMKCWKEFFGQPTELSFKKNTLI